MRDGKCVMVDRRRIEKFKLLFRLGKASLWLNSLAQLLYLSLFLYLQHIDNSLTVSHPLIA